MLPTPSPSVDQTDQKVQDRPPLKLMTLKTTTLNSEYVGPPHPGFSVPENLLSTQGFLQAPGSTVDG